MYGFSLNRNILKLIALFTMTLDHLGVIIFTDCTWLRIIGRLSFPIFAYMISEGCQYTRSRSKYLLRIFLLGLLCQLAYYIALKRIYLCILITFTLSILIIYSIDFAKKSGKAAALILPAALAAAVGILDFIPAYFKGGVYEGLDYGFWGVLLPVFIYCAKTRSQKLVCTALGLIPICLCYGGIQWFSLFSLPLLMLYNGHAGKRNTAPLFYIYYPAHLAILYAVSLL